LGLSLIYIGLFIIISENAIYIYKRKYSDVLKIIIYFLLFIFIKDQIIDIINNVCIQQILSYFYNVQINIIKFYYKLIINLDFYQGQLLNSIIYECQDKTFTIETKSFIIEKHNNNYYKNIINNYIINNYISFNNNNYYIKLFTKELIIHLESLLIGLQKIVYEYINYITPFYNFYSNYKILINKHFIQTDFENLYYNTSLNLLLNSAYFNDNQKDFLFFLEKKSNRTNPELIKFLTNYYNTFNNMTFYVYKSITDTLEPLPIYLYTLDMEETLIKKSKVPQLTFGLNYDLNINSNNIYNLN
jgi:hypothetical protein